MEKVGIKKKPGSRYYRPPELILGCVTYGCEVDWWSVACVIAEMLTARCLFCGDSSIDQLVEIVEVLGPPTQQEIENLGIYDIYVFELEIIN